MPESMSSPLLLLRSPVVVRPEPPGLYTAQVVGIPEIRATAATRDEAIEEVRNVLKQWLDSGQLVQVEVPQEKPSLQAPCCHDRSDPLEKEFQEDLERFRREDLERTLQDHDRQCSNSSSTPTT